MSDEMRCGMIETDKPILDACCGSRMFWKNNNENQETVAGTVAEMRDVEAIWHRSEIAQLPTQYLKVWSDRIEAAHKRELEDAVAATVVAAANRF